MYKTDGCSVVGKFTPTKRGGGGLEVLEILKGDAQKSFCVVLTRGHLILSHTEGGKEQKVSDPRFSHF